MCAVGTTCAGASAIDSAPPTGTRPGAELVYVSDCLDPEVDLHGYWVQRCTYHPVSVCPSCNSGAGTLESVHLLPGPSNVCF